MSKRHGRGKPSPAGAGKFPRRRWLPGQRERAETPKKGKGAYKRSRRRRRARKADNQ